MYVADPRQVPADVYMYTLHPARPAMLVEGPTDEERALAARHWVYSQELLARGAIVFAGRTVDTSPETFATVVIRADSPEAARAIMEGDPAVEGGVFRARLFQYQPMLMGEWPASAALADAPANASAEAR
jgi:uncharacterized protein YciI